jgi:hypothetical protein
MEKDFSRILYEKYFSLTNRNIEIALKNGKVVRGMIIGFYRNGEYSNKPYILKWHIVNENDKMSLGVDSFGFMIGEIIKTTDIAQVRFIADGSFLDSVVCTCRSVFAIPQRNILCSHVIHGPADI